MFFGSNEVIGRGNTSFVFKGILGPHKIQHCEIGQSTLAVKRLKNYSKRLEDYESELRILARVDHPHIINVVGCCAHRDERFIVYEFMPFRTLSDWLFVRTRRDGEEPLIWRRRMEIGAGIAKALMYLHNEADPRIIYRGLSPNKVLLGDDYQPKLFDFRCGVSVPSDGPLAIVPTNFLWGSSPYLAPEVSVLNKLVTPKADVYSFGVVLRQMISGRAREPNCLHQGNVELEPHWEVNDGFPIENWVKATALVNHCLQDIPESRPDMQVLEQGMRYLANEPNVDWPVELLTEAELLN